MREDLKRLISSYLRVNGFIAVNANDLIDEYESEQTFTELEDGTFEMVTGNTTAEVVHWLHKKGIC